MNSVKQNTTAMIRTTLRLRDYMEAADASGVAEGRIVHARLLEEVKKQLTRADSATVVFVISMEGVRRTDASFPRESVMQLAHRFRPQHGFCLWHLDDSDLLENWEAAADRRIQPMLLWHTDKDGFRAHLLGPKLTEGLRGVFDTLLVEAKKTADTVCGATTSEVAERLGLSISNASNKLKTLWEEGYILRREQVAASGGIEFRYFVAR